MRDALCVFPVTSVGSVRQPFRHPAMVNPLTGWLAPQSGLLAGGRSAGKKGFIVSCPGT